MSGASWYAVNVHEWGADWRVTLPRMGLLDFTLQLRPVESVVWRDANATAGTWPEVITLEHEPMWLSWAEGRLYVIPAEDVLPEDLLVPLFVGDVERRAWRRRKWWGRGPIVFAPFGDRRVVLEAALLKEDIERISGVYRELIWEWAPNR